MSNKFFVANLERLAEHLDGLVEHLKQIGQISEEDLKRYDLTSREVERRLEELKHAMDHEISPN